MIEGDDNLDSFHLGERQVEECGVVVEVQKGADRFRCAYVSGPVGISVNMYWA
ncbi:hypothetical protein [uncultured Celeribacter sp.]|uniref:hypothetical protein n=1 Tax=uncultured Celeribacter sp. TaxID=1303376 RepID=UPI002AA84E50|nr:hypothetical protein [uncultured Celeribacter sp.]